MFNCLINNSDDLQQLLAQLRLNGKKIVFTNGCFDIMHAGHVEYLSQAKLLGDILIVGLNSDDSVSRLKPGRPINNQYARASVLCALKAVDYVVFFDEDTPYELIKIVRPDVLVKGGDWKKEDIVGSDIALETISLKYLPNYSTTAIIKTIIRKHNRA